MSIPFYVVTPLPRTLYFVGGKESSYRVSTHTRTPEDAGIDCKGRRAKRLADLRTTASWWNRSL